MKSIEETNVEEKQSDPGIIYEGDTLSVPVISEQEENLSAKVEEKEKRKWQKKQEIYSKNHALTQENEQLKVYLLHMKDLLDKTTDFGSYNYEEKIKSDLEKAQDKFTKAAEDGDAKAAVEATTTIARIQAESAEYERNKRRRENDNIGATDSDVVNEEEKQVDREAEQRVNNAADWIKENPEIRKGSKQYNENLSKQVIPFIKKLEDKLRNTNQSHLIASDLYFDIIDQYMDSIKNLKTKTNGYNGSTSNRYANSSVGTGFVPDLTKEQKRAAAAFGMTEKEYIQSFKKHEKEYVNER